MALPSGGVSAPTDNVAGNTFDKYGATNPIERRMMAGFFAAFDACLDGATPATVLEVGAGEGTITKHLIAKFPAATVVGLDLPDDTLAARWRGHGIAMLFGDATGLPFAAHTFDLVVGLEVLEHIPDTERALTEIARVCRQRVVLSVPREPIWRLGNMARGRYVRDLGNTPGHINHWSANQFEHLVSPYVSVEQTHRPLPWTMLAGSPRIPS